MKTFTLTLSLWEILILIFLGILFQGTCFTRVKPSFTTNLSVSRRQLQPARRTSCVPLAVILHSGERVEVPATEKARLFLNVVGEHCINPLFRAELKKELTFFRGCNAYYSETGPDSAIVIAEGKVVQLERFLQWLDLFSVELSQRKPSFQAPNMIVHVKQHHWEAFSGKLKGFQTKNEAPELEDSLLLRGEGVIEAKNMTGTDESV